MVLAGFDQAVFNHKPDTLSSNHYTMRFDNFDNVPDYNHQTAVRRQNCCVIYVDVQILQKKLNGQKASLYLHFHNH